MLDLLQEVLSQCLAAINFQVATMQCYLCLAAKLLFKTIRYCKYIDEILNVFH